MTKTNFYDFNKSGDRHFNHLVEPDDAKQRETYFKLQQSTYTE